jgi:MFS family permease
VQAALFFVLGPMHGEESDSHSREQRPIGKIIRQPAFLVAVLGGVTAYGVMTLIMTATPLSMHIKDGFSLEETAQIIRSHVLAMYVPSLFSGFLIERLGIVKMMSIGGLALIIASVIGMQGHTYVHYWYVLVLLGVGWNFLYVGGTTMLTHTYSINERFKAQAVNEFTVFGTAAAASLLAGTVIHLYGWYTLVLLPLPLLVLVLCGLFFARHDPLVQRLAPRGV